VAGERRDSPASSIAPGGRSGWFGFRPCFPDRIAARRLTAFHGNGQQTMVADMDWNILPIALAAFTLLYIVGWFCIEKWRHGGQREPVARRR
jgi:hypothetical protein